MPVKLFILGLPGSGKSAASRLTEHFARENKWKVKRFRDYGILHTMSLADVEPKRFRPTKFDGFDVLDLAAFDEALEKLNRRIEEREKPVDDSKELLIIEFSRNDYCNALSFFSSYLLEDAYFLFIDAKIQSCMQRVEKRVTKPVAERNEDDNYVSEFIFDTYYERDHRDYLESVASQMGEQFGIRREKVHVIYNGPEISEEEFHQRVTDFAINILRLKA